MPFLLWDLGNTLHVLLLLVWVAVYNNAVDVDVDEDETGAAWPSKGTSSLASSATISCRRPNYCGCWWCECVYKCGVFWPCHTPLFIIIILSGIDVDPTNEEEEEEWETTGARCTHPCGTILLSDVVSEVRRMAGYVRPCEEEDGVCIPDNIGVASNAGVLVRISLAKSTWPASDAGRSCVSWWTVMEVLIFLSSS